MPLVRLKIDVSPFMTKDYTGKFVKSMLIYANPELENVFEDKKYPSPKPIRITPLLSGENEVPIYPKAVITKFGESSGRPKKEPSPIEVRGIYHIYIGYYSQLEPQLHIAFSRLMSGIEFEYGTRVRVRLLEYESIEQSVPKDFNSVKIYFITPAIFVDPFIKISQIEKDRTKRFLPFPPIIFSVNVYDLFKEKYKRNIIRLSYSLVESHTALNTVTKVW
ncbi:MAG: CRISPR-associated protein Cas6, partial [Sulfolobaceae archaeon]